MVKNPSELTFAHLRPLPVSQRAQQCHPFIKQVIELSKQLVQPASIVVFGSRARGDQTHGSDIDIAIKGVQDDTGWAKLASILEEHGQTLYAFDMVRYEQVSPAMQANIDREGICVYEQPRKNQTRPGKS